MVSQTTFKHSLSKQFRTYVILIVVCGNSRTSCDYLRVTSLVYHHCTNCKRTHNSSSNPMLINEYQFYY